MDERYHAMFIVKHDIYEGATMDEDDHEVTIFTYDGDVIDVPYPPDNGIFTVPQYDPSGNVVEVAMFLCFG